MKRAQKLVEFRMRRIAGAGEKVKEAMEAAAKKQDDWYTNCHACGARRMGTVQHLQTEPCDHCGAKA